MLNSTLVVIPARGGSKGIPNKNIRLLGGKPLIQHTIDIALTIYPAENIIVSTDNPVIKSLVEGMGLYVPFLRPEHLASDTAGMQDVLLHALFEREQRGVQVDAVLLMQPTSPFRHAQHLRDIYTDFDGELDMIVSVGSSHHNPYFSLFEESSSGFLKKSKDGVFERRQDCPSVYFFNGSLYLINPESLKNTPMQNFRRVKKYLMEEIYCLDIDTPLDWLLCEALLEKGIFLDENN